jgi:serine/threonine-protein kinase
MDLSATTVATSIDMDWDEEEEPQTNMRDELLSDPPPRVTGADFDPVVHVPAAPPPAFLSSRPVPSRPSLLPPRSPSVPPIPPRPSGAPSPFARSIPAPAIEVDASDPEGSWDDDDARTRVLSASQAFPDYAPVVPARPTVPPPAYAQAPLPSISSQLPGPAIGPAPWDTTAEALRDDENPFRSRTTISWPWVGLAAVLAVGLALWVRTMMAPPALATVTLSTQPVDAQVSVDGRPLIGQTSPFTIQGLSPEAEHTLVVSSEGRGEHRSTFRVSPGETKALENVELVPKAVETGFVLASTPPGARVLLDGEPLAATTPVRLTDLAPGAHTLRLEHGDGFQPWETQIALAEGQLLELPAAQLIATVPAEARDRSGAKSRSERRAERRARRAERRAERAAENRSAAAPARAIPARVAAPAPVASGSGGTLRVNTRPWAQVFIDGKLVGNTPQLGIPLKAGSHRVKLVNPDLGLSKQITVKVKAGQTVTKILNLVE